MKHGEQLTGYVNEIFKGEPLILVETGCLRRDGPEHEEADGWSTLYFARWIKEHPESKFFSADNDIEHIHIALNKLESEGIKSPFPMFYFGESVEFLNSIGHIDFAYLDSCDGWEHGLAEFQAAESKGAKLIVMDDYISKVVTAAEYAASHGWDVKQEGRFTVMRRV